MTQEIGAREIGCGAVPRQTAAAAVEQVGGRGGVHAGACAVRGFDRQGAVLSTLASLPGHVLALALPPRCPACGAVTGADHRFCAGCWGQLRFLGPPWCAGCALPFEYDRGAAARCPDCLASPPRHSGVRAAVAYGDVARDVVLKLKYGRRLAHAETIARLLVRHVGPEIDLIVPVPLHRWRLWSRGYNQSALIAAALGKASGRRVDVHAAERIKPTPVLRGLGRVGRRKALAGAFAVPDRDAVGGRHIALIDDVYTTGATSDACTAALLRAGAASVTILCWARVIDGDDD